MNRALIISVTVIKSFLGKTAFLGNLVFVSKIHIFRIPLMILFLDHVLSPLIFLKLF